MLCKKCGGNLVQIENGIVQCENCLTKYRVKLKQPTDGSIANTTANVANNQGGEIKKPEEVRSEKIEIDHTKPFSSRAEQAIIDKALMDLIGDDLNRTLDDDLKARLVKASVEPELADYSNAQDVNDAIKEYEEDNYPETRPIMEKIYCSKCGKPVDLKTGICPQCQTVMPLPERKVITCPFCQYENNNIYSEFCIKCNKDLDIERERLGIVLKLRATVAKPSGSSGGKKKKESDDSENGQTLKKGSLIASILTVIIYLLQGVMFFGYVFIKGESLEIKSGVDLISMMRASGEELIGILKGFGIAEEKMAILTENTILMQILSIAVLVFILSIAVYIISVLYNLIIKKSTSKVGKIVTVMNFISSILLLGISQFISFKVAGALAIGACSSLIGVAISFIGMFISFMII